MITVTKPFLPVRESLNKYIDKIYASNWLTNFGPLEQELTERLKDYLQVDNLLLLSNGTLALQVLYRALKLNGEVITTPFSFVATTSSLVWEKLTPVFCDIDKVSLNIDPTKIEALITSNTSAILPVHVFGRASNVWEIEKIAQKYNLKVIYDAAHAFNVYTRDKRNILSYGDASTLSFHATKLFHTIEGGAIIAKDSEVIKQCKLLINFGISGPDKIDCLGTNCKMNEFQAAMGLAVLDNIDYIMGHRQDIAVLYRKYLPDNILLPVIEYANDNYSYFPVLFASEVLMLKVRDKLAALNIFTRRYFFPSLDGLSYVSSHACENSRDISSRILCLPMYPMLTTEEVEHICTIITNEFKVIG